MIFCANPKAQYLANKSEIDAAVLNVLESGTYILGEQVSLFEQEFAEYLEINYAIGCASGTDALILALEALNIGSGDEVIVPSHTAVPTVAAVVLSGAIPVFVDIEPDYFTISPEMVHEACTDKTKAIIAVHLYGQSCAMDELMEICRHRDLRMIEDCAQAAGASYRGEKLGTIGDVGCFSFFPTKNLGAIGDGGAIACRDKNLSDRLFSLRQYGWDEHRISRGPGMNSRLDELQAALLRVKLRSLDTDNVRRQKLAHEYETVLKNIPLILPNIRKDATHVFHLYVTQCRTRDDLDKTMQKHGVKTAIHYPVPVHMQSFFQKMSGEISLPVTEQVSKTILSLPIYPELSAEDRNTVTTKILDYFSNNDA